MVGNEAFLDTAQKRSSVVSHAKVLGYTPTSAKCSTTTLNVNLINAVRGSDIESLPVFAKFQSSYLGSTYDFYTINQHQISSVDDEFIFENVSVYAGKPFTDRYTFDASTNELQKFKIVSKLVDTNTVRVFVRQASDTNFVLFSPAQDITEITSDSEVYFLQESFDGFFEIYFGQGILGKSLENGSDVRIEYLSAEYTTNSNGCVDFSLSTDIGYNTTCLSFDSAFGGAGVESIESIKETAPKAFAAQNRAVTASDYDYIIKKSFPYVTGISVWGGEDNSPPVYGKVFISLSPEPGKYISLETKNKVIAELIRKKSVLTVIPEFVDPDYIYV